ncbi:GAF and ANTAR domain-containing protein [Streptomyces lasalocidi]|uniref:GAF and ANTAR domain-containing protein n=1 Tax=Streptomyces lasalocidi TaxID=324833 RepID=UPI001F4F6A88|nr:GAF and ANTAR domain-containing protein [Streptomyces lasalocidi]
MSDRDRVAQVLAEEVRGADPAETPGRLCHAAVRLLPVTGASVSLCAEGMPVPLSASSPRVEYLMEVQATLGDGPCLTAAATGAPVFAWDLEADRDALRWPVFAQHAAAAGIRAVYALPLGHRAVCVGTLDLYREAPGTLDVTDLDAARIVADEMTRALMALTRPAQGGRRDEDTWLHALIAHHDEVYQAVGMVMAQLGVAADEALARLRARAFAQDRTVMDMAHEVVGLRQGFDAG